MLARLMFAIETFKARKGLGEPPSGNSENAESASQGEADPAKERALQVGVRGETYAYWYLRRHGYVVVARNFTAPGLKGEIDMVGYDGAILAFVEVKTRTKLKPSEKFADVQATPESAVNIEKRRNISRMARQFLRARHIEAAECRFDVLAIETRSGEKPVIRLHKGAFNAGEHQPRRT